MSDSPARPILRPTMRFALAHPAHFLALGFGTGVAPIAPGTVGTLVAFPIHWLLLPWLPPVGVLAVAIAMFVAGIWICGRTSRALGLSDHSGINWDEIAAFLAVLAYTPAGWGWQLYAFLLFRVFDVLKPPPIRHFDQTVKGGFGVMLDDAMAAGYTFLVLMITKVLMP